jgi:hypothetical protein
MSYEIQGHTCLFLPRVVYLLDQRNHLGVSHISQRVSEPLLRNVHTVQDHSAATGDVVVAAGKSSRLGIGPIIGSVPVVTIASLLHRTQHRAANASHTTADTGDTRNVTNLLPVVSVAPVSPDKSVMMGCGRCVALGNEASARFWKSGFVVCVGAPDAGACAAGGGRAAVAGGARFVGTNRHVKRYVPQLAASGSIAGASNGYTTLHTGHTERSRQRTHRATHSKGHPQRPKTRGGQWRTSCP